MNGNKAMSSCEPAITTKFLNNTKKGGNGVSYLIIITEASTTATFTRQSRNWCYIIPHSLSVSYLACQL